MIWHDKNRQNKNIMLMRQKNRLKEIRISEGITASALAKSSDVATRTIARAEKGEKMPKEVTLYKIVKGLNRLTGKNFSFQELYGSNSSIDY